ncbi:expansin EXLX1 family cellulose-binding protein [Paractinoplanes atraurantiacus]|uniref:Peptidoglycan-binding domain-containing protein, expansin n=1 Tax=Paractinoplanes atraurantiacus TaxID=1036182 RepID=A0A285H1D9_9ACTN|nr:expansin EXLX1 family cellulose-binding protein [Actinoplanes atraurantiacus]SNY29700.1 Peptidoglycan-binding domain-containing protein, expansin [Actinoplanes atraurantiacus]
MTGRFRLLTPRWLAAGGAAVLAAVLGLALVFQNSGAACAAPPSTSASKGKATYFSLDGTLGNCSFPSAPADDLFVALGQTNQYSEGAACGTYIDVKGPKGSTRVKVIDSCPECPVGHLDLSLTAFKKIGVQSDGIIPITYKTVPNAAVPGPISVRVKEGSSQYWLSVLIDNHSNQLASVKIAGSGGTFKSAEHEDFNYWTLPSGAGNGPFKIKITDIYGNSVTVPNIKLAEGKTQKTGAKLASTTSSSVKSSPAKKKAPATKKATPSPTSSKKPAAPKAAPSSAAPLVESTATSLATAEPTVTPPAQAAVDLAAGTPSKCG